MRSGRSWHEAGKAARETRILALFERDPERFDAFSVRLGDMLLDFSKTALDARALTLLIELAEARGVPERRDAMFRGRADQHHRGPGGAAHRAAQPREHAGPRRRPRRDAGGQRRSSTAWRAFADGVRVGRDRRGRRRALHRRRQHRHRRQRPRAGDGDAGAGALSRRAAVCTTSPTSTARISTTRWPGSTRAHAGHHRVEDLHHHRDDDQRPHGAGLAAGDARRRRRRALRRRLDRARQDRGLRHRPRAGLRLLGLGRRALFGLGRGRAAGDDRRSGRSASPSS